MDLPPKYFHHKPASEISSNGFENLFLNCWLNVSLQALLSCTGFNECITSNVLSFINDPVAVSYMQILSGNYNGKSIDIRDEMIDVFATTQLQKCAFDGMMKLIARLDSSCSRINDMFKCVQKFENVCPVCHYKAVTYGESNFIQHTTFKNGSGFVEDLCRHDTELTDYVCSRCSSKSDITRVEKVVHFGEIICIMSDKLQNMGQFPDHFTVMNHDGKHKYVLVAIIDHNGSRMNGHYTARVLRRDGWVQCNDTEVSRALPSPTGSEYILLYELSMY